MIAFLLTAAIAGFVIVYVVPKANGYLAKIPGTTTIVNNKFAQLLIVGAIVVLSLHLFLGIVQKVE